MRVYLLLQLVLDGVRNDSGGLNALIDVNTSVTGIRNVIENLTIKNSGKFWDYNGEFIPW